MPRRWVNAGMVLLLCCMVTTAWAKKKKDPPAPKLFCQAQYAYVKTIEGDVLNSDVLPQDRQAANQLVDNLQTWKRYTIVYQPNEADLVFVVRTGRVASARGQGTIAGGPPYQGGRVTIGRTPGAGAEGPAGMQDPSQQQSGEYPQGAGVSTGAELGPPNDLLQVYSSSSDTGAHTVVWERTERDGLQGSQPLFQKLRDAVQKSCQDPDKSKGGH
ncbi:MAG TPA: hypothetical protein VMA34_02575 [Terracidiphilus sp.]|nr:hypothetical protein [Terracidiphilus sp.]